ncbi:MAG: 5'/3'-nucleotidase SurE [Prevotella sp.]|nr:5'/3'-nucleotidase SurE [Prevotella sp.]
MQQKPLILISNDDGYEAKGIRSLVDMLRDMADILVCAPDSARSGYACAFSAVPPLTLTRRDNMGEGVKVWSCSGTPVDCVKLAYDQFCRDRKPDLVLGGINHGDNSTVNAHYSGTVGVALEGCMKYLPSIAFSSCNYSPDADFSPLKPLVRQLVQKALDEGMPRGVCWNVNFPALNEFKGLRVTRMTMGQWINEVVTQCHPRGYNVHWMVGHYRNDEPEAEDSDQWAINHGYVALTPIRLDVTAYDYMPALRASLGL